jgi:hypothetical protein
MRNVPPSQRPERQGRTGPEALGEWMLRFRKHWQAAHHVITKMGLPSDTILMSTPHNGPNKPPEVIDYLSHQEAKALRLPSYLLSSFDDPTDGRFYCLAAKASGHMQGSYIGQMKPDSEDLPTVTVRRHGSDLGVKIDPTLL